MKTTPAGRRKAGDELSAICRQFPDAPHVRIMTDGALFRLELLGLELDTIATATGYDLDEAYTRLLYVLAGDPDGIPPF